MRANDFAYLGIRLLAIYLFIQGVVSLPSAISIFLTPMGSSLEPAMNNVVAMGTLTSGLTVVVISAILWAGSSWLSDFMTRGLNTNSEITEEWNIQNLYVVGITVLGVFIVATSLPNFFSAASYLLNPPKGEKINIVSALGPFIQMAFGLLCAFKTEAVVSKLKKP